MRRSTRQVTRCRRTHQSEWNRSLEKAIHESRPGSPTELHVVGQQSLGAPARGARQDGGTSDVTAPFQKDWWCTIEEECLDDEV